MPGIEGFEVTRMPVGAHVVMCGVCKAWKVEDFPDDPEMSTLMGVTVLLHACYAHPRVVEEKMGEPVEKLVPKILSMLPPKCIKLAIAGAPLPENDGLII